MSNLRTDNTVLTNGIIKNNKFYPKMNLQSGTLRIVLTTECNFKCKYCFAEGEKNKKKRLLDIDKLKQIILASKDFGIHAIKLTGGEPLLYPNLEELLKYIRKIGIPYVDLTTNISLLNSENLEILNEYNVNALTLSLNTLNCQKYEYLTGFKNYTLVEKNLLNVKRNFNGKIRINCIVFDEMFEENDYNNIMDLCKKNNFGLRFVEPSKVEPFKITYTKEKFKYYIDTLRKKADKVIQSDCESVEYLFFDDWYITVMHSLCDNRYCSSCKKHMYMRISSEYKLKPCLSRRDTEVNIDFSSDESIKHSFIEAISYMGIGLENE